MTAPVAMAVPKELWRMVDYLVNRGSTVTGLWTDRGVAGEDVKIRDCLDENRPFEAIEWARAAWVTTSVHSMADCLLDWFCALQSPVIPEKCTSRIEKGEKINSEFVEVFMNMVMHGRWSEG